MKKWIKKCVDCFKFIGRKSLQKELSFRQENRRINRDLIKTDSPDAREFEGVLLCPGLFISKWINIYGDLYESSNKAAYEEGSLHAAMQIHLDFARYWCKCNACTEAVKRFDESKKRQ